MTTLHEQIVQAYNNYIAEAETFQDKSVKAAAARARSQAIQKLTRDLVEKKSRTKRTQCNARVVVGVE